VDRVFLDGAADARETMREFRFFEASFHAGSPPMCRGRESATVEPESMGFAILIHEAAL